MLVRKVLVSKVICWVSLCVLVGIRASEFPERECCDGVNLPDSPQPPRPDETVFSNVIENPFNERHNSFSLDSNSFPEYYPEIVPAEREAPESRPVDLDNAIETTTGLEPGKAILDCILARQLCTEQASCSSMLTVIRHICGLDTVACATATVTKCQAGLRTLQAFPFFRPTCLCREPHLDPECNGFRNFLFDHPCMVATQREKDKYPFDALPICTHAMEVCQTDPECISIYNNFRDQCKVKEGRCRMENRDDCYNAWRSLRTTPLFGCICPNNQSKKRCDRVYTSIYNNSCIGEFFSITSAGHNVQHAPDKPTLVHVDPVPLTPFKTTMEPQRKVYVKSRTVAMAAAHTYSPTSLQHSLSRDANPRISASKSDRQRRFVAGRSKGDYGISSALSVHNPMIDSIASQRDFFFEVQGISHVVSTSTSLRNDSSSITTASRSNSSNTMSPEETDIRPVMFQSTCHRAQSQCQLDQGCRRHLDLVFRYCDSYTCNRDLCMQALQGFYKNAPSQFALEVAFCVCKKSSDRNDACLIAQEKLHPGCARRSDRLPPTIEGGNTNPANYISPCNQLVDDCKAHPDCRPRLEFYEQACAVDVATKGCAGPPARCRQAVLDVLGTELRTTCTCRGGDILSLYECLEWQKLLWLNPCVVEAQRDFHKIQGNIISVPVATSTIAQSTVRYTKPMEDNRDGQFVEPLQVEVVHDTGENQTEASTLAYSTTTTTFSLTTAPSRFCVLTRTERSIKIPLGTGRRFYREDDPDCSEICRCILSENLENLTCSTYCAERKPCNTAAANYSHSAASFQAYRGECICLSGVFVCARPDPAQYTLSLGVFLFLGYSQTDEKAMERWTNLSISKHVLEKLQQLIRQFNENYECRISIHDHIQGNLILQVRLAELDVPRANNNSVTYEMLKKEKVNCSATANRIRHMINAKLPELHEDELLSVIKVSDVSVNLPEPRRSCSSLTLPSLIIHPLCLMIISVITHTCNLR